MYSNYECFRWIDKILPWNNYLFKVGYTWRSLKVKVNRLRLSMGKIESIEYIYFFFLILGILIKFYVRRSRVLKSVSF